MDNYIKHCAQDFDECLLSNSSHRGNNKENMHLFSNFSKDDNKHIKSESVFSPEVQIYNLINSKKEDKFKTHEDTEYMNNFHAKTDTVNPRNLSKSKFNEYAKENYRVDTDNNKVEDQCHAYNVFSTWKSKNALQGIILL